MHTTITTHTHASTQIVTTWSFMFPNQTCILGPFIRFTGTENNLPTLVSFAPLFVFLLSLSLSFIHSWEMEKLIIRRISYYVMLLLFPQCDTFPPKIILDKSYKFFGVGSRSPLQILSFFFSTASLQHHAFSSCLIFTLISTSKMSTSTHYVWCMGNKVNSFPSLLYYLSQN